MISGKSFLHSYLSVEESELERFASNQFVLASKQILSTSLRRTAVIAAQHLVPSTSTLVQEMVRAGLRPENLYVLGKCYSSFASTIDSLLNLGAYVSPHSLTFDPGLPYDLQYQVHVQEFLSKAIKDLQTENIDRCIVLDDGGYLISEAAKQSSSLPVPMIGVEQTSSGYARLKELGLGFPVVNVARSWAKLTLEAKWIGEQAAWFLDRKIESLPSSVRQGLILGSGAIGQAIQEQYKNKVPLIVIDPRSDSPNILKSVSPHHLESSDFIIGCTGNTSLPEELHGYITKGTVLASLSSSDREFDAVFLRDLSQSDVKLGDDLDCGGIKLLNCGFPISFQGPSDLVDPPHAYFTRALLCAGIQQGNQSSANNPCFLELDLGVQRHLTRCFRDILSLGFSEYVLQKKACDRSALIEQTACY